MKIADLNQRFGLASLKFVEGPGGLIFAEIDNELGQATLCLQGAHVTTFRPKRQSEPVIWLSDYAKFAVGKSIRGGVPVCWPWFGPHATESGFPGHGFARTAMWTVTGSAPLPDGETQLTLHMVETAQTIQQWPHATRLEVTVVVGEDLTVTLSTTNMGDRSLVIGEALHTYLHIGDIAEIRITGLEGCAYVDKVDGGSRKTQSGPLTCSGEVDRVYLNTAATCAIEDARLNRRLVIEKSGSNATVVWTPWAEKADRMGDFGPDGWRCTVCVESANALDNVVSVTPGATHRMQVSYRAEPL
jgi:glucose-6-phosphate 1-epimerase